MELVDIGSGHRLAPAPAASYLRARAAGCPAGITSSYRDPVRQAAMRAQYEVELVAYRAGRGPKPTFVARVQDSEHVDGNALDLPAAPREWMREHPDYGWVFTDPTEAWHVAHRLDRDRHLADAPPAPPARRQEDDDMQRIITNGSNWAITNGQTKRILGPADDLQLMADLGVVDPADVTLAREGRKAVSPAAWDRIPTVKG